MTRVPELRYRHNPLKPADSTLAQIIGSNEGSEVAAAGKLALAFF